MTSPQLRRIRIVISSVIFFCFFMVFIDLSHVIPSGYTNKLLFLQFIPSFVKFYNIKTFAATGFLFILILTLLSGRTYCSFLCPLGIWQDIFSRIGGRIKKNSGGTAIGSHLLFCDMPC
ncbi:MAG: 4Fe-4S binding protein [Bacteroidales bacterium]|nr:4Fe-4S binding protein [Bacteroidales bacterium]